MNAVMEEEQRSVIGRTIVLVCVVDGAREQFSGKVMDNVAGTNKPKRVRVPYLGRVLMPSEYEFLKFGDEGD